MLSPLSPVINNSFKKLLVFNWKNGGDLDYAQTIFGLLSPKADVVICPPDAFLSVFDKAPDWLILGAQNLSAINDLPCTGEITANILKKCNVKYVIIGHSERRLKLSETTEIISTKILNALLHKLVPIICVRGMSVDADYISHVIKTFTGSPEYRQDLHVAFEPTASIGTGSALSSSEMGQEFSNIKKFISTIDPNIKIKFLYGGSVDSRNIEEILKVTDGVLIGGASLKIEEVEQIFKIS